MTGKRGRKRKYKGAGAQTSKMGKGWMWQEQKYTIEGDKVFLLSNSWEKYSKEIELWGWSSLYVLSFSPTVPAFALLSYSLPFL